MVCVHCSKPFYESTPVVVHVAHAGGANLQTFLACVDCVRDFVFPASTDETPRKLTAENSASLVAASSVSKHID